MNIIEVRGGVVVAVYSDSINSVVIIDHDESDCIGAKTVGCLPVDPTSTMPADTAEVLKKHSILFMPVNSD
jgi:hypothetical protein